ncbi:MAG: succinylglutamate desuccinylase/aspartoacylase family protein [Caldilineae bacterium]|nr:succinylglutamate desuccinylase/aspartoacylase family protein [Caldilineae bacterium]
MSRPGRAVPLVERLDLAGPAPGSRQDLWLRLGQDGLGQPVAVPVALLRGRQAGPVVGLAAALHGDELNGIGVLHRLLAELDPMRLRGTVVALLVTNVPGFLAGTRRYPDGYDLNHIMPGDPEGKESERYAHHLVERLIAPLDLLFDLHTASLDRANSLYVRADLSRPEEAALAWRQRPQIILDSVASPTTLRGTAAAAGKPSITLEIGDPRAWQPDRIAAASAGLRANLIGLGLLEPSDAFDLAAAPEPIVCSRSSWLRLDAGGLVEVLPELGARVAAGEPLARLTDVFGQTRASLVAPEAGVVIGRAVSPFLRSGGRVLHLGIPAAAGELPLIDALRAADRPAPARPA